jgi:hypothetical protein
MTSLFAITAASNTVQLSQNRAAETTFTVANNSGRAVRGRAKLGPDDLAQKKWLQLAGDVERDFAIAGAQQYVVKVNVPPDAPAGNYSLRLDMVGIENPDADYTEGPTVAFQVPQGEVKRKFPWWIIAAAAVIVILAVTTGLVFKGQADSRATATARAAAAATQTAQAAATVTAQAAATMTAQAIATQTAQAAATMTAQASATIVARQTASAAGTATAQAMEVAVARYNGTWAGDTTNSDLRIPNQLVINSTGNTVNVQMFDGFIFVRDQVAAHWERCRASEATPAGCLAATGSAAYTGDPVTVDLNVPGSPGLVRRLTLVLTSDGSTIGVVEQFLLDNRSLGTNSYPVKRQ